METIDPKRVPYTSLPRGKTFVFLNRKYKDSDIQLEIGDEVICHPVLGISQATKSYPCVISIAEIPWSKNNKTVPTMELVIMGREENINYHGAVLNEYGFNRLEFVKRKQ